MERERLRLQNKEQQLARRSMWRKLLAGETGDCLLSVQSSPIVTVEKVECAWYRYRQGVTCREGSYWGGVLPLLTHIFIEIGS